MRTRFIFLFMILMTTAFVTRAQPKISFDVSFTEPQAHYIDVQMEIDDLSKDFVDLKMPVWAPGSYLIREFPKNVESVQARTADSEDLKVYKIDKNTWRVENGKAEKIVVNYRIYAFEVSVRTSFVDESHAFLSPTGVFLFVDGFIDEPTEVTVTPYEGWSKISTGLEPVTGQKNTFYAENFDILFDSPIEVGNQDVFEFTAAGVKHEVAMVGGGNYDKERLKRDMASIVEESTAVFGVNPNKRYVFIVHNYASGGGGLEHLNSTVLGASRFAYSNPARYNGFLGLVAHEYFHVWNIKRLRPENLGPFNYSAENYTTNLWIAEGFTAYYDNLLVRRAGFYDENNYLRMLTNDIEAVENRPGNLIQPLSLASFDAWIKYYRPDENSANTSVSYYNKGALMGMLLDLKTLHATNGEKRLDDIMKAMYDQYYNKLNRGFTDAEFKSMAEKVAGISIDDIYHYVNNAEPIDYNKYLNYAGMRLVNQLEGTHMPDFGVRLAGNRITSVSRNSGAWNAGLNVHDELIGINGYRIDEQGNEMDRILGGASVGDEITVLVSRDGVIKEFKVTLPESKRADYVIEPMPNATKEQISIRKIWLSID